MAQLSIPDSVHEALKKHCKKNNLTLREASASYITKGISLFEAEKKAINPNKKTGEES